MEPSFTAITQAHLGAIESNGGTPADMIEAAIRSAYPQIVADVLNHYADAAESPESYGWVGRFNAGTWLRAQAAEVLS